MAERDGQPGCRNRNWANRDVLAAEFGILAVQVCRMAIGWLGLSLSHSLLRADCMQIHRVVCFGVLLFALMTANRVGAAVVPQVQSGSSQPDVRQLSKALQDKSVIGRLDAIEQLRRLGPQAAPATDSLIESLRDMRVDHMSQRRVGVQAANALAAIGQPAIDTVVAKLKAAKTPAEYLSLIHI